MAELDMLRSILVAALHTQGIDSTVLRMPPFSLPLPPLTHTPPPAPAVEG